MNTTAKMLLSAPADIVFRRQRLALPLAAAAPTNKVTAHEYAAATSARPLLSCEAGVASNTALGTVFFEVMKVARRPKTDQERAEAARAAAIERMKALLRCSGSCRSR
jgi:hypothetical protein